MVGLYRGQRREEENLNVQHKSAQSRLDFILIKYFIFTKPFVRRITFVLKLEMF